jgi:hypothetical protein
MVTGTVALADDGPPTNAQEVRPAATATAAAASRTLSELVRTEIMALTF